MCVCNLLRSFVCLISTDMFPRKFVDYTRRLHARVHTLKDVCVCTLPDLLNHVFALHLGKHMKPFFSPNFPQV